MKTISIPKETIRVKILCYSQHRGDYTYSGWKLTINNIPDGEELIIKAILDCDKCWKYIKYNALRKDWILYNITS